MRSVTSSFQNEVVTQTRVREIKAKIIFRQVDTNASSDSTTTSTSTQSISDPSYMTDEVDEIVRNYSTLETGRWKLGGEFVLLPSSAPYDNMGWWGAILSDSSAKTFTPNITVTCTFSMDHSSEGITINFDNINDEYATEFDVKFYNSSNVLITTLSETTNTDSTYINETPVSNYRKIEVVIKKWSLGDRRARISEIIFGVIKEFSTDSDNLITATLIEEVDLISTTIPTNELTFEIDNSDSVYDILNPTGIYQYLQQNQKINVQMGVVVGGVTEYAEMGTYYFKSLKTERGSITAKFTANDLLSMLSETTYYKGIYTTDNLYDMAIDVLTDFGLTSAQYNIDTALQSISVTSFIPVCTHREALQRIAIAGQCVLYVDRDDIIQMIQLSGTSTGITLDFDNMYDTPEIQKDELIKQIDTNVYSYTEAGSTSEVYKGTLYASGTASFIVTYNDPSTTHSYVLSSGTVDSITYYTNACYVTITATGSTTLTISGKKLTEYKTPLTVTTGETTGKVLEIDTNLISDVELAIDVCNWALGEKYTKRDMFTVEWRMNPALELCDIVSVESQFETSTNTTITKQQFEYTGGLTGKTYTRK